MLRMTEEEYFEYLKRTGLPDVIGLTKQHNLAGDAEKGQGHKKRESKYRNKRVYVYDDGMVSTEPLGGHGELIEEFDSVKEYQRCRELRMLEKAGKISNLNTQAVLVIQEKFQSQDGKKYRTITYRADFMYIENGVQVVEDVKGYDSKRKKYLTTQVFDLKWKLLIAKYPDYKFQIY